VKRQDRKKEQEREREREYRENNFRVAHTLSNKMAADQISEDSSLLCVCLRLFPSQRRPQHFVRFPFPFYHFARSQYTVLPDVNT